MKYTALLKEKINKVALKYLMEKQGKKGSEIKYSCMEMQEYLLPLNNYLTTEQKCELFAIKNRMINIPDNFSSNSEYKCVCGKIENMKHIYQCEQFNEQIEPKLPYEKIFNGKLKEQIEVYRKFKQNLLKREKLKEQENPVTSVRCVSVWDIK